MNLFGVIIGQHILMLGIAVLIMLVAFNMMNMGWWMSIPGIAIFAGTFAWTVTFLLYKNAHIPRLGLPLDLLVAVMTFAFAGIYVFSKRNTPGRKFSLGKKPELDRNTVIASIVLTVCLLTAWVFLSQGNWDSFFHFDNRAANQAYDQTHNGALRFINKLLAAVDEALAK